MYFSDSKRCWLRYKGSCMVKEGRLALEIHKIQEPPDVKLNNDT
jgi:hypothetical protein